MDRLNRISHQFDKWVLRLQNVVHLHLHLRLLHQRFLKLLPLLQQTPIRKLLRTSQELWERLA